MRKKVELFYADIQGRNGKERQAVAIVVSAASLVTFLLIVYLLIFHTRSVFVVAILVLSLILLRMLSAKETPQPNCCPLYELVRHCLFEAVVNSADETGLKRPVSESGLDMVQRPSGDGVYRFEYRLRINRETVAKGRTDMDFLKEILSEEIAQSFQKNAYQFQGLCQQCGSLYIEAITSAPGGFEVVIVPVCAKTSSYVQAHYNRCLMKESFQGGDGRPQDDLF